MFRRKSTTEAPQNLPGREALPPIQQHYPSLSPTFAGQLPSLRDAVGPNYGVRPPSPADSMRSLGSYNYTSSSSPYSPYSSPTMNFSSGASNLCSAAQPVPIYSLGAHPFLAALAARLLAPCKCPRGKSTSVQDARSSQSAVTWCVFCRVKLEEAPLRPAPSVASKRPQSGAKACVGSFWDLPDHPDHSPQPSGLRTLCNACGLVGSKLNLPEPASLEDVLSQLEQVGKARYRVPSFTLLNGARERAAQSWVPPDDSAHAPFISRAGPRMPNAMEDYEAAVQLQALSGGGFSPTSSGGLSPISAFSSPTHPAPSYGYRSSTAQPSAHIGAFGLGPSATSASSPSTTMYGAYPFPSVSTPALDRQSKRLSQMSMEEKDPTPSSSASSSSSSGRMDLASLMNRPASRNSTRRLSFSGPGSKSFSKF